MIHRMFISFLVLCS